MTTRQDWQTLRASRERIKLKRAKAKDFWQKNKDKYNAQRRAKTLEKNL